VKAFLRTYGCQANERDSETIAGILDRMGYQRTGDPADADLIILNTCSIRDKAEQKVFSYLGVLARYKEEKKGLIIGLCGCMTQQADMVSIIRDRAPYVDFLLGTRRIHLLSDVIDRVRSGEGFVADLADNAEIVENLPSIRPLRHKALINITYGCDNFCSYCVVPYVRGRERSRAPEDILAECRARVAEGAVELMFLGQNVNSYGKSFDVSFARLLYLTQSLEAGPERIRFLTSHPRDFGDDIIQAITDCPKVARHIHLPVQSGSNRVLRMMNRGYTREDYLALVERIQSRLPGIALTTDIIVGFPGEKEEDLRDTVTLLEQVGFNSAFTFMYSPRRGTAAEKMPDQIPQDEKKARLAIVMETQAKNSKRAHNALVGKELSVLADGWENGLLYGRGQGNQLTYFPGEPEGIGAIYRVRVTKARTWTLEGEAFDERK